MKRPDWILFRDATQGDLSYAMECRRCGEVQKVISPIPISVYYAMGKAFARVHSRCRVRQDSS